MSKAFQIGRFLRIEENYCLEKRILKTVAGVSFLVRLGHNHDLDVTPIGRGHTFPY